MAAERTRRIKLLTAILLVTTFVAGGVTGAGFWHLFGGRPPPPPPPLPVHELDLTAEQKRQVHEIHERHAPQLEAIVRDTFPRVRAVQEEAEKEVRAVLTPDQQRRFDEMRARRRPGPPPPFPPPEPPPR